MRRDIEPNRLELQNYPHRMVLDTQFGDMDVYGHINNIVIARYFECARARSQLPIYAGYNLFREEAEFIILLAETHLRFLAECHFPDPVEIATAFGHIGTSSYQFAQALFQNGHCIALGEAAMVATRQGEPVPLPDDVRQRMEAMLIGGQSE